MTRSIYSTYEKGKLSIRYNETLSPRLSSLHTCIGVACPWTCMCLNSVSETLRESTYVYVWENRIEYNYPYSCLSCCCSPVIYDNIHVIYYDRSVMQQVTTSRICSSVILSSSSIYSTEHNKVESECCGIVCLPCIFDPEQLASMITTVRDRRLHHIQMDNDMIR